MPESDVKERYPKLWAYLQSGKPEVSETYLCRHRSLWYERIGQHLRFFVLTWGHLKVCALKHANSDKPRTQNSNCLIGGGGRLLRGRQSSEKGCGRPPRAHAQAEQGSASAIGLDTIQSLRAVGREARHGQRLRESAPFAQREGACAPSHGLIRRQGSCSISMEMAAGPV